MKKITTLLLIAIFIFAFQSCKKAEETTPGGDNTPTQEEYVSCKIDGVDFLSKDEDNFNTAKIFSAGGVTIYQLRGGDESLEAIILGFYDFDGVGIYNMADPDKASGIQYLTVGPPLTYDCSQGNALEGITSGKIEITFSSDERVEGTFECIAVNSGNVNDKVTITDGSFRLNY
ncbi:MAG: hypothetical protein DRJ10_09535 [Bacteroidetes bacterium]|nr:MAG: hypothetical protein DRJ10_09535 [Bacteroidota bacterium]